MEWVEAVIVSNKLHEILPKLSDKLISFVRQGKKTVLSRLHIGYFYLTDFFVLKKKKTSLLFVLHITVSSQSNISWLSVLI